ncbi:MAG: PilN domain-containing protein [Desulfobacteraceae bacterium]|nr:PilN domain-containing protein [Desulfobacteraceae bacterium]
MAGLFLNIEIDEGGICAQILEISFSQKKVVDEYCLQYEDLPETKTGETCFHRAMDLLGTKMDLAGCTSAVVLISSLDVCFRNINLPFTSENKIKQVLPFELAPYLPLVDKTYVTDFFTQDIQSIQDQQAVLTASVQESVIEQLVLSLKKFNIHPCVICPRGYALAVSFLKQRKDVSNFVFIHIGQCDITLTIVVDRKPVVVRSFVLTEYTPERLVQDTRRTILGFRQRSGSKAAFDVFMVTSVLFQNTSEITQALNTIVSKQSEFERPGFRSPIVEMLDSKKILTLISPDSQPDFLFNFCKGQFKFGSFLKKNRASLISTFFIALFVFGVFALGIYEDIAVLEHRISVKKQAAESIYRQTFPGKAGARVQAPLLMMQAKVKQMLKQSGGDTQKNSWENAPDIQVRDILFELSNSIPAGVDIDISRMILNRGRLTLSGSTNNFKNVDKIKGLIEKSDLFKKVDISRAEAGKTDNRVLFKFIIDM